MSVPAQRHATRLRYAAMRSAADIRLFGGRTTIVNAKIRTVNFSYRLTGTGWAEATLADAGGTATIPASYLVDTLGVLLDAIGALLGGSTEARCSWELEPGEYRWLFTRMGASANLRVLRFDDAYPAAPDDLGVVAFETNALLTDIAVAFADGAQAVRDEHGETGYLEQWVEHPFPAAQLNFIRATLAS